MLKFQTKSTTIKLYIVIAVNAYFGPEIVFNICVLYFQLPSHYPYFYVISFTGEKMIIKTNMGKNVNNCTENIYLESSRKVYFCQHLN